MIHRLTNRLKIQMEFHIYCSKFSIVNLNVNELIKYYDRDHNIPTYGGLKSEDMSFTYFFINFNSLKSDLKNNPL